MRIWTWLAIILLLSGAGWWFFKGGSSWQITNAPPRKGPIIAMGDSLTSGVGAGKGESYVDLVSAALNVPIFNAAIPGATIADAAARADLVVATKPSVVILLIGGNDYLRRNDLTTSFQNLEALVRKLQAAGAVVILVGLEGIVPFSSIGKKYKTIAQSTGSVYVPNVLKDVFGKPALMADAIHPNAAGYKIMAERIQKALEPYAEAGKL